MRIVCISDTHGFHREVRLPLGDVLIHAGDFMRSGKIVDEIKDFNYWLGEQPFQHRIVIAGNHDLLLEARSSLSHLLTNAVYLQDSGLEIDRIKFWGSPWTTRFMNWAFMSEPGMEMKAHWDKIPSDIDVLITHGPPRGVLDCSAQFGDGLGCVELMKTIEKIRPKLHVFGHIHFGYGIQIEEHNAGSTTFLNAAQVDEAYRVTNKPLVFRM